MLSQFEAEIAKIWRGRVKLPPGKSTRTYHQSIDTRANSQATSSEPHQPQRRGQERITLQQLPASSLIAVSTLAGAAGSTRVATGAAAGIATSRSAGARVATGPATCAAAHLHVADLRPVSILVGFVFHHLSATVRQQDEVDAARHLAVARLLVAEVVARGRVVHRVLELVLGRGLRVNRRTDELPVNWIVFALDGDE